MHAGLLAAKETGRHDEDVRCWLLWSLYFLGAMVQWCNGVMRETEVDDIIEGGSREEERIQISGILSHAASGG